MRFLVNFLYKHFRPLYTKLGVTAPTSEDMDDLLNRLQITLGQGNKDRALSLAKEAVLQQIAFELAVLASAGAVVAGIIALFAIVSFHSGAQDTTGLGLFVLVGATLIVLGVLQRGVATLNKSVRIIRHEAMSK